MHSPFSYALKIQHKHTIIDKVSALHQYLKKPISGHRFCTRQVILLFFYRRLSSINDNAKTISCQLHFKKF